jgi:hypothetical protein
LFKVPDHLDVRHYKCGRSSAVRTGRLYPRINSWYSFSEAESTSEHMVLSEGTMEKIPSDTTGNRSRDLPTSSVFLSKLRTDYIKEIITTSFFQYLALLVPYPERLIQLHVEILSRPQDKI